MNAPFALFPAGIPVSYNCPAHGAYSRSADATQPCPQCVRSAHEAREAWRGQWKLYASWIASAIPTRYRNRTLANFAKTDGTSGALDMARRYVEDFAAQLVCGIGLLLIGGVGTGKTHLGAAVLTEIVRAGHSGAFCSVGELFAMKRPGYAGSRNAAHLTDVDLLVVDDLGASRGTEWEVSVLSDLVGARYDAQLPTIVTTNLAAPKLATFVGDRAADRFRESMLTAYFAGGSYRCRAAGDDSLRRAPSAISEPPKLFEVEICYSGKMVPKKFQRTKRGDEPMTVRPNTQKQVFDSCAVIATPTDGRQEAAEGSNIRRNRNAPHVQGHLP